MVVLDRDLHVAVWNADSEELWGLRCDEVVGRNFLNLDMGFPAAQLCQTVRDCLSGQKDHQEVVVEAINRRGRTIRCAVTCSPLRGPAGDARGSILIMAVSLSPETGEKFEW